MNKKTKIVVILLILYWGLIIAPNWIYMYSHDLYNSGFKLIDSLIRFWAIYMAFNWRSWKTIMLIGIFLTMSYAFLDVIYKVVGLWYNLPKDHWYWVFTASILAIIIYMSKDRFDFSLAETVPYDPNALMLLAYRPPKGITEVILCIITRSPYGSYKLIVDGKQLGFSKKTSQICVKPFIDDGSYKFSKCEISQERIWNTIIKYQTIIDKAPEYKGIKRFFVKSKKDYHILLNNCYQFKKLAR